MMAVAYNCSVCLKTCSTAYHHYCFGAPAPDPSMMAALQALAEVGRKMAARAEAGRKPVHGGYYGFDPSRDPLPTGSGGHAEPGNTASDLMEQKRFSITEAQARAAIDWVCKHPIGCACSECRANAKAYYDRVKREAHESRAAEVSTYESRFDLPAACAAEKTASDKQTALARAFKASAPIDKPLLGGRRAGLEG